MNPGVSAQATGDQHGGDPDAYRLPAQACPRSCEFRETARRQLIVRTRFGSFGRASVSAEHEYEYESRRCPICGAPLMRNCTRCGHPILAPVGERCASWIMPAGDLPAKAIIHLASMNRRGASTVEWVGACLRSAFALAAESHGIGSLGVATINSGPSAIPLPKWIEMFAEPCVTHLHPTKLEHAQPGRAQGNSAGDSPRALRS